MTNEQVLNYISKYCTGCLLESGCEKCMYPVVAKALERQIPKKTKEWHIEDDEVVWTCQCGVLHNSLKQVKYCYECGQRINWRTKT